MIDRTLAYIGGVFTGREAADQVGGPLGRVFAMIRHDLAGERAGSRQFQLPAIPCQL